MSMKNSSDTIGNWIRDLPACTVAQCLNQLCYRGPHLCMCGKHYCIYSNNAWIMDHIKHLGDLFVVGLMFLHQWQSLCGFGRGAEGNWVLWTVAVDVGQVNNLKTFFTSQFCAQRFVIVLLFNILTLPPFYLLHLLQCFTNACIIYEKNSCGCVHCHSCSASYISSSEWKTFPPRDSLNGPNVGSLKRMRSGKCRGWGRRWMWMPLIVWAVPQTLCGLMSCCYKTPAVDNPWSFGLMAGLRWLPWRWKCEALVTGPTC